MTHFLDSFPLDFTQPATQELQDLLSVTYFQPAEALILVQQAGVGPDTINWNQPMRLVWHQILVMARNQNKIHPLMQVIIDGADAAVALRVQELIGPTPITAAPSDAKSRVRAAPPPDPAFRERQIARESTLLDVAFLERGVYLARSVVRLLVEFPSGEFYGTGFRITDDKLLTELSCVIRYRWRWRARQQS